MTADKAVLKALKGAKGKPGSNEGGSASSKALDAALKELRTETTREAVKAVHAYLAKGGPDREEEPPIEALGVIVTAKLAESAEHVFCESVEVLAKFSASDVVNLASTPRCLNVWLVARAKAQGAKDCEARKELVGLALGDSEAATQNVLAAWYITVADRAELPEALAFFQGKAVGRWAVSWEALLTMALERDGEGSFGARWLEYLMTLPPEVLEREMGMVRGDSKLCDEVVRVLPMAWMRLPDGTDGGVVLGKLFDGVENSRGAERRRFSARLTRLASTFLSMESSRQSNDALRELDAVSQRLGESIPAGEMDGEACGVKYYGRERGNGAEMLSERGAKLMAIAMGKLRDGMDALTTLETTAFNLGMRQIEEAGEVVNFDPQRHEDMVGGAYPGEAVKVKDGGWRLGDDGQVIERAKVRKE